MIIDMNISRQMCTAVDSIHDIASGQYQNLDQGKTRDTGEDTLLYLLTRVRECLQSDPTCLTDIKSRNEIEDKVKGKHSKLYFIIFGSLD